MAKSRRKAGGATSGRYKPKKMGKGWSSYRASIGFRPPASPGGARKDDEAPAPEPEAPAADPDPE